MGELASSSGELWCEECRYSESFLRFQMTSGAYFFRYSAMVQVLSFKSFDMARSDLKLRRPFL